MEVSGTIAFEERNECTILVRQKSYGFNGAATNVVQYLFSWCFRWYIAQVNGPAARVYHIWSELRVSPSASTKGLITQIAKTTSRRLGSTHVGRQSVVGRRHQVLIHVGRHGRVLILDGAVELILMVLLASILLKPPKAAELRRGEIGRAAWLKRTPNEELRR